MSLFYNSELPLIDRQISILPSSIIRRRPSTKPSSSALSGPLTGHGQSAWQADTPIKRERATIPITTFPYPVDSKKTFRPGPKTITMTPQVPNDHLVDFVDQMAAEKLKDQTKSKPALADGLYLAQGHRHVERYYLSTQVGRSTKSLLRRDQGSNARLLLTLLAAVTATQ